MAKGKEHPEMSQQEQKNESPASSSIPVTGRQGGPERGLFRRESEALWSRMESPFAYLRRFMEDMERIFEEFNFGGGLARGFPDFGYGFLPSGRELGRGMWSPQIEVFERDGKLVVCADLPGLRKEDIHVEIREDSLIIQGERKQEFEETREGRYHSERRYGRFYRSIPLPEGIDVNNVTATFRNGVLEITMPVPQQQQKGRRIEIQGVSEGEQSQPLRKEEKAGGEEKK